MERDMKKNMIAMLAATVVAATPMLATSAFAQYAMGELTMLEQAANNHFVRLGITQFNMGDLTLSQLAEIKQVLNSNDYNYSDKKFQIEKILNR
jgi:hypothetical protein